MGKHYAPLLLPATPLSPSRTLEGLFELTRRPSRCQKFTVQVPVTKVAVECNPVYDEKCKTTYPKHCKVETRCHQVLKHKSIPTRI